MTLARFFPLRFVLNKNHVSIRPLTLECCFEGGCLCLCLSLSVSLSLSLSLSLSRSLSLSLSSFLFARLSELSLQAPCAFSQPRFDKGSSSHLSSQPNRGTTKMGRAPSVSKHCVLQRGMPNQPACSCLLSFAISFKHHPAKDTHFTFAFPKGDHFKRGCQESSGASVLYGNSPYHWKAFPRGGKRLVFQK